MFTSVTLLRRLTRQLLTRRCVSCGVRNLTEGVDKRPAFIETIWESAAAVSAATPDQLWKSSTAAVSLPAGRVAAPQFGCGSPAVGTTGTVAATAFSCTDTLAGARSANCSIAQTRQSGRDWWISIEGAVSRVGRWWWGCFLFVGSRCPTRGRWPSLGATPKPACWSTRLPPGTLVPMETRGVPGTARRFRVSSDRSVRPRAISVPARMPLRWSSRLLVSNRRGRVGRRIADRLMLAPSSRRAQPRDLKVAVDLRCVALAAGGMVRRIALSSTGAMNLDHSVVMCDLS